jgi:hypothetical protein
MKLLIVMLLFITSTYAQALDRSLSCITETPIISDQYFYAEISKVGMNHVLDTYLMKRTDRYSHSKELIFSEVGILRQTTSDSLNFKGDKNRLKLNVRLDRPMAGSYFESLYIEKRNNQITEIELKCSLR